MADRDQINDSSKTCPLDISNEVTTKFRSFFYLFFGQIVMHFMPIILIVKMFRFSENDLSGDDSLIISRAVSDSLNSNLFIHKTD